jgi:hypothetical protein
MNYKGVTITKLFPSGYYEAYVNDRFYKADTLQGIKRLIDEYKNKH